MGKSNDAEGERDATDRRRLLKLREELYDSYIASTDVQLIGAIRHLASSVGGLIANDLNPASGMSLWWKEFAAYSWADTRMALCMNLRSSDGSSLLDLGIFARSGSYDPAARVALARLNDLAAVVAPIAQRVMGSLDEELMPGYWRPGRPNHVHWLASVCRVADMYPSEVTYAAKRNHFEVDPSTEDDTTVVGPLRSTSYAGWQYRGGPESLSHDALGPFYNPDAESKWYRDLNETYKSMNVDSPPADWPKPPDPLLPPGVYFATLTRDVRICYADAIDCILEEPSIMPGVGRRSTRDTSAEQEFIRARKAEGFIFVNTQDVANLYELENSSTVLPTKRKIGDLLYFPLLRAKGFLVKMDCPEMHRRLAEGYHRRIDSAVEARREKTKAKAKKEQRRSERK